MQGVLGVFNNDCTAKLHRNLLAKKKIENRLRFDRVMATSLRPDFFGPLCRAVTDGDTSKQAVDSNNNNNNNITTTIVKIALKMRQHTVKGR